MAAVAAIRTNARSFFSPVSAFNYAVAENEAIGLCTGEQLCAEI